MNDLKGIIEDCNKSDLVSDKIIKKVIEIIGQEEWQDLHDENNDVCTTMGELIITLKGIADLEKENAELKDDNKVMADNYSKMEQKFYDNLTKAKDHIKKLLDCLQQDTNDPQTNYYVVKYMTEAEQFIKDCK